MEEFILKERETKEKIMTAINQSNLPAVTVKAILKEFLEQIIVLEQQQYQQALNNKEMKEKEEKEEKEEKQNG